MGARAARHVAVYRAIRVLGDLGAYGWRSGRWWMPVVMVVLLGGALLVVAAKAVLPTVVYTLF